MQKDGSYKLISNNLDKPNLNEFVSYLDYIQEYALNQYPHRLSHEFAAFAAMLANKDFAGRDLYLNISLQVAEAAEKSRKQADISFLADQYLRSVPGGAKCPE